MLVLKSRFYDKFSCKADRCILTCCCGWRIIVDDKAYNKYRRMKADHILKNIETEDGLHRIKLNDKLKCHLLDERGLCSIVLTEGEEWLCDVCNFFPREGWRRDSTTELGLSNACEGVLELLMDEPTPLSFIVEEYEPAESAIVSGIKTHSEYRNICIDILQAREIPFERRICIYYLFTDMYCGDRAKACGMFSQKPVLMAYSEEMAKVNTQKEQSLGWLKILFDTTIASEERLEMYSGALGCEFPPQITDEGADVMKLWDAFIEEWDKWGDFWENSFVNSVYNVGEAGSDCREGALLIILEYCIRKYALFLLWMVKGVLDKETIIAMTVCYARLLEHNPDEGFRYSRQFGKMDWDERAWIMSILS